MIHRRQHGKKGGIFREFFVKKGEEKKKGECALINTALRGEGIGMVTFQLGEKTPQILAS